MSEPYEAEASPATGRRWRLSDGAAQAYVCEAGAALLGYRVGGRWLTEPSDPASPLPAGSGQLLVPWPNRVRDGRWLLEGQTQHLALTEPSRANASHGLLRHASYAAIEESGRHVRLRAEIFPQSGYPFRLTHTVTWELLDEGLRATHEVTHQGEGRAPVAIGAHPYLRVGDADVADCTLAIDAHTRIVVDERLLPVGTAPVSGEHDWRSGPPIGARRVDSGYADLRPAGDGLFRHTLRAPDGHGVALWADPAFAWVQVFVTDRLPGRDLAVAVEPMTAPADALNSGEGIVWLADGDSLVASWGLDPVSPGEDCG